MRKKNRHKRWRRTDVKPAPTDYTTDEEDIITYDVEEDEIEQHLNLVEKKKTVGNWKGSLLLTPTMTSKITISQ
ncbi:hypothetical protein TNCV_2327301 [Trichonephila clavipes]|nr:hypothetical protein TNCV_2327301 [Trichonephila clavipes]